MMMWTAGDGLWMMRVSTRREREISEGGTINQITTMGKSCVFTCLQQGNGLILPVLMYEDLFAITVSAANIRIIDMN